jgi:5'-deoxynucleotidase YfbR-like HD superfamily hydrolase
MSEFIYLSDGKKFYFERPDATVISIEVIAHALSQLCRWTGHTKSFYSIAEHSWRVSVECKKYPLRALLHDAAEAFTNDINKPLKITLGPKMKEIEDRIEKVIWERFGFPEWTEDEQQEVKRCDLALAATEARDLFPKGCDDFKYIGTPLPATIRTMGVQYAEAMFLERYRHLTRRK